MRHLDKRVKMCFNVCAIYNIYIVSLSGSLKINIVQVKPVRKKQKKEEVMKKLMISLVFLVMVLSLGFSQEVVEYLYPELKQYLYAPRYMVQTKSGVVFATMGKDQRVWMVKLDNDFQVKWSHQVFAGTGQTGPTALVWSESENCFYISGMGLWNNKWKGFLIKIDSLGTLLNEVFPFPEYEQSGIQDMAFSETKDSIFVIGSGGNGVSFIACFDTSFQKRWKTEIQWEGFEKLIKMDDGIIVFGYTLPEGQNYIMKVDLTGNLLWKKNYNSVLQIYNVIRTNDNKILFTGKRFNNGQNNVAFLKKFDSSGNLIWEREFDFRPELTSCGNAVFELNDGSDDLILIGNSGEGTAIYKTHVLRLNEDGIPKWEKLFLGGTSAGLYDSETGYLVLGGCTQEGILRIVILYRDSTSVQDEKIQPEKFLLKQNYPNPFNAITTIEYTLLMKSSVNMVVYNMMGQVVSELINSIQEKGLYYTTWNAQNMSSGVYFVRISAKSVEGKESFNCIKKMTLMK